MWPSILRCDWCFTSKGTIWSTVPDFIFSQRLEFIHIEIAKSRKGPDLLAALQRAVKFFADRGAPPLIIRMDNECAQYTKSWLATTPTQLELTPVAQHRTNKAERAIGTWKDHFIATLATWQAHGKLGYYIGRALSHYRCHTVYMEELRATRISDGSQ